MKRMILGALMLITACGPQWEEDQLIESDVQISLPEIAGLLSALPLDSGNVREVHDAVSASSTNGYDEEYMMRDLLTVPGSGVGDDKPSGRAPAYGTPICELIREYLREHPATRSGNTDADTYIEALERSGAQIYWPYSSEWDGRELPVITYNPGTESTSNTGYELFYDSHGDRQVREIIVDEEMARQRPVWVVNSNEDSSFTTIQKLRRDNPDWGEGGAVEVRSGASDMKMLVLKEICMKRNFDTWFQGASEFFIKCGYVSDFTASTEAELQLFQPSITDFMVVVRRGQVGQTLPFNVILATDWTEQQESVAFMMVEDDGGTQTSWKLDAVVKVNSKSYGIEVNLPYHEKDDIVWRGSLSYNFFQKYDGSPQHFGDADLTFAIEK